ncbi:transposase [Streptomyces viridosporus ATCC 14672]|uniref:Transposase n=1 Tax=Streptomyces viridosporus (strain ATCC 14672 / DSM 40746 / JCM 4963 / KCTC 9882 / NRRL B-12104 / FH 1290) TaxID=566461 RepID=D5ZSN3_STRV1|nr:transposase [Streptomyces viridosporus ATCC 14672]
MICHEEGAAAARLLTCDAAVEELLPQLVGLRIERMDASPVMLRITAFTRDDVSQPCPGADKCRTGRTRGTRGMSRTRRSADGRW